MRKIFLIIWTIITLLVFGSIFISPQDFEYVGLLGFAIPVLMALNIVFLVISWVSDWKAKWVLSLLVLLAWPFYGMVYQFNFEDDANEEGLKVMSQNLMRFNYRSSSDPYELFLGLLESEQPDVLVLQEFAATRRYRNGLLNEFNFREALGGYANSFAIYTTYPIIRSGALFDSDQTNNIQFADIQVDSDTVRIYNLHLQSMGINPQKLNNEETTQDEFEDIGYRFTSASQVRSAQMAQLFEHIEDCSYPVILAGDFNDIPFSHNYMKMKKGMTNAFEEKGRGFGATFNNNIPFLRIDNQFCSEDIQVKSFETLNDFFFSDHFPLIGIYQLSP